MSHEPDMKEVVGRGFTVGWLHPDHPHASGQVPPDFVAKLADFARLWRQSVLALNWPVAAGCHICEYCGEAWGSGTFGVPSGDRLFHAPDMIAHYVERHRYAPPPDFIGAVLASPLPGTPEYEAAVARFRLPR